MFYIWLWGGRRTWKFNLSSTRHYLQFSSVQLLSRVRLFVTPWIAAHQASLSIINSQSSLKFTTIELVMPSNHLILYCLLLLLPAILPSIRVFSNESTLRMRWPKYWSFSFRISPSNEHPGLISIFFFKIFTLFYFTTLYWFCHTLTWSPLEWTGWISVKSKGLSESSPTPQSKSIHM